MTLPLFRDLAQGGLHAATIQRGGGGARLVYPAMAIGKRQHGIAMDLPEAAQEIERDLRQRYQTIPVSLGVADMHAAPRGVNVTDLQTQAFAKPQAETVEGEKQYPVTEGMGRLEKTPRLFDGHDIRQALCSRRFDQMKCWPGFFDNMGVVKLEAVEIQFYRCPRVRGE